jgi:hypothetical protein
VALADINTTESSKLAGIASGATRNVVTYSASAPASPLDGDLWVDTSGTFAVFKLRVAGAWQTGANALEAYNSLSGRPVALADINTTESSKLAGIEANATRNIGRDTYAAGTTYQPGDMLLWSVADGGDGGGYVRIGTGGTTGVAPSDSSKWARLVERGQSGDLAATGQFVALGWTTSAILPFVLPAGASRVVSAQLWSGVPTAPSGSGTMRVDIEYRINGGAWITSTGATFSYTVGEPFDYERAVTISNSEAFAVTVDVRATGIRSAATTGSLRTAESFLAI